MGQAFPPAIAFLWLSASMFGADRQVAITIDDLPRGGDGGGTSFEAIRDMTVKLLRPFHDEKIPVTGFVNSGRTSISRDELRRVLSIWIASGADLGNHTFSHADLSTTPPEAFEADITRGESVLEDTVRQFGKKLEFFRYPYLHTGTTIDVRARIHTFLVKRGYRNAPVTFDDSDYMFARAYTDPAQRERVKREYIPYMESVVAFFEQRSIEVVGREFPQILLIHASQMNADMMPELLAMFKKRGYSFVSLNTALQDEAYRLPEEYVGRGGFSWIHRWSKAKGMPDRSEPDEPKWLGDYVKEHP